MKHLADNGFKVIALRDLARYVDAVPINPWGVIEDRQRQLAAGRIAVGFRPAKDDTELRYWLENMAMHRFALSDVCGAKQARTGSVQTARHP